MIIRIHFSKRRALEGLPWTLHTSKGCFAASKVHVLVLSETESHPQRRNNPRHFVKCDGRILWNGTVATIMERDDT